eukprot:m.58182 g.58182  ORF g.58182 m.58182 type:complete len:630 (-) comp7811_c0_seq2:101-1990(-)
MCDDMDAVSALMDSVERLLSASRPTAAAVSDVTRSLARLSGPPALAVADTGLTEDGSMASTVEADTAAYAHYLVALALLCMGDTVTADAHLSLLHCGFRLGRQVWAALAQRPWPHPCHACALSTQSVAGRLPSLTSVREQGAGVADVGQHHHACDKASLPSGTPTTTARLPIQGTRDTVTHPHSMAVYAAPSSPSVLMSTPQSPSSPGGAAVWDHAVSPRLLSALQRGFDPSGTFWSAHGYDAPGCKFFSYHCPLDNTLEPPRNAVECCARWVQRQLRDHVPGIRQAKSVEWWAHKRCTEDSWVSGAHQLHFDTDEATFGTTSDAPLRHPLVSSVLFLSDVGGPTLVTNKVPGQPRLGTRGALAWPTCGRLLTFDGNALHGVLPDCGDDDTHPTHSHPSCPPDNHPHPHSHSNPHSHPNPHPSPCLPHDGPSHATHPLASNVRLTLIMAWWDETARPRWNDGGLGPMQHVPTTPTAWHDVDLAPMMPVNDDVDADDSHSVHACDSGGGGGGWGSNDGANEATHACCVASGLHIVEPLWEAVETPPTSSLGRDTYNSGTAGATGASRTLAAPLDDDAVGARPSRPPDNLPPLRLFVDREDAFERLYEEAAVAVYWERVLGGGGQDEGGAS